MLILCNKCFNRIRNRGEEISTFYSENGVDDNAVCDVCGEVNFECLQEVTFPEEIINQQSL